MITVIGAGLSGLLAGVLIPNSRVVEAAPILPTHRGVLRFRSPAVGDAVGIPFRKVTVRKGIYFNHRFHKPSIRLANFYSSKVTAGFSDRSIWNINTAERWIAPEDFQERLAGMLGPKLTLGRPFDFDVNVGAPLVSTVPMPVLNMKLVGDKIDFKSAGIFVQRWRIPNCNVYQTVYFPDPVRSVYRASITGDVLSVEHTCEAVRSEGDLENLVRPAFGVYCGMTKIDEGFQNYGKIVPVDEKWRRNFIINLSKSRGIYSLGRFATWRNILLDDVLNDIAVIKKLISGDEYQVALESAKR